MGDVEEESTVLTYFLPGWSSCDVLLTTKTSSWLPAPYTLHGRIDPRGVVRGAHTFIGCVYSKPIALAQMKVLELQY